MGKRCWEGGGKADLNYGAGGHVAAVVGHGVLLGMACCWAWRVVGHGEFLFTHIQDKRTREETRVLWAR